MNDLGRKLREAEADIAFLVMRANSAGSCDFTTARWTGMSSNALVAFAYGGKQDVMPSDRGDYAACVRTYHRLPRHRKTREVKAALLAAREAYLGRYPAERFPKQRKAAREEFERLRAEWAKRKRRRRA